MISTVVDSLTSQNTANLLRNIFNIPTVVVFAFTMALIAGFSMRDVAWSLSVIDCRISSSFEKTDISQAMVVSLSFALGPSIERIVSSIQFIFGSNPYEGNCCDCNILN